MPETVLLYLGAIGKGTVAMYPIAIATITVFSRRVPRAGNTVPTFDSLDDATAEHESQQP